MKYLDTSRHLLLTAGIVAAAQSQPTASTTSSFTVACCFTASHLSHLARVAYSRISNFLRGKENKGSEDTIHSITTRHNCVAQAQMHKDQRRLLGFQQNCVLSKQINCPKGPNIFFSSIKSLFGILKTTWLLYSTITFSRSSTFFSKELFGMVFPEEFASLLYLLYPVLSVAREYLLEASSSGWFVVLYRNIAHMTTKSYIQKNFQSLCSAQSIFTKP